MNECVELSSLHNLRAFDGPTAEARGRSARRWAESLPPSQALKKSGRWMVDPAARLPDGCTIRDRLMVGVEPDRLAGLRLPPGHEQWNERQRQRFLDTHELISQWRQLMAIRRGQAKETIAEDFAELHGQWAHERGLKCTPSALRRYHRRLDPSRPEFDGNVDLRGRQPATQEDYDKTMPPMLWQLFTSFYLRTNQLSVAECYRIVKAQARRERMKCPSLRTFQACAAKIPKPVQVLARKGQRRFEADCVPKLQRDYESIPAGEHWIGDERTFDLFCRVPDARKGWRLIRPKLTAWLDLRSRSYVGWYIGERANTDTILAALKRAAAAYGFPQETTIDNGKDIRSIGGKHRRKWADFDETRLGSVFAQAGVAVHYACPYHAWAKPIEPMFKRLKETFDRHQPTYCGGCPREKPADLPERLKDILSVPTVDDVRCCPSSGNLNLARVIEGILKDIKDFIETLSKYTNTIQNHFEWDSMVQRIGI